MNITKRSLVPLLSMHETWFAMIIPVIPFLFFYESAPDILRNGAELILAREYGSWTIMTSMILISILTYLKMFQDWGKMEEYDVASGIKISKIHLAITKASLTIATIQCLVMLSIIGIFSILAGTFDFKASIRWALANLALIPICWSYLQIIGIFLKVIRQPFIALMVVLGVIAASTELPLTLNLIENIPGSVLWKFLAQIAIPDVDWFVKLLKVANYGGPDVGFIHWVWLIGCSCVQASLLTVIFLVIKPNKQFLENKLTVSLRQD